MTWHKSTPSSSLHCSSAVRLASRLSPTTCKSTWSTKARIASSTFRRTNCKNVSADLPMNQKGHVQTVSANSRMVNKVLKPWRKIKRCSSHCGKIMALWAMTAAAHLIVMIHDKNMKNFGGYHPTWRQTWWQTLTDIGWSRENCLCQKGNRLSPVLAKENPRSAAVWWPNPKIPNDRNMGMRLVLLYSGANGAKTMLSWKHQLLANLI